YSAQDAPPAIRAVLVRFAGAVALRAAFLELFDAAASAEELADLLARENAALLDDPSAGIRAHAAEWPARKRPDLLPEGYAPLAPARERQAALSRLRGAPDEAEGNAGPERAPGEEGQRR